MNFALSEEHFSDPETRDLNNKAFWGKLSEVFQLTLEMVKETAHKHGIDLNSLDLQAAKEERRSLRDTAEKHECCRAAKSYSKRISHWFDSTEGIFEQKADELNLQARLELPDVNPEEQAATIKDVVDIIRWYQHFIYVKILRALQSRLDDVPFDSDGSAKVALIAIDRSIAAWGQMYEHFSQCQDDILNTLVHLRQLRQKTQTTFPNAMAFIRPGLDE